MNFSTATAKKVTPTQHAKDFVASCEKYGFTYEVSPRVVKISKKFDVSGSGFADTETEASIILDHCPLRGGSVWGTDGGSMGGAIALQTGIFKMNKSGNGAAFAKAVAKLSK